MPYTTLTAGSYATSDWANTNVRDQVVSQFASTTARDAAITSPVDGMVCYINSNNANEGLYTYAGSTGGWTKGPGWNAPWGQVARDNGFGPGTSTSSTTETVIFTGSSFTALANRFYRVYLSTTISATAGDSYQLRIRLDSVSGTVYWNGSVNFATGVTSMPITAIASTATTAGSHSFVLTAVRTGGTGTAQINTLQYANMTVEDIGPSGAPA